MLNKQFHQNQQKLPRKIQDLEEIMEEEIIEVVIAIMVEEMIVTMIEEVVVEIITILVIMLMKFHQVKIVDSLEEMIAMITILVITLKITTILTVTIIIVVVVVIRVIWHLLKPLLILVDPHHLSMKGNKFHMDNQNTLIHSFYLKLIF